MPRFRGAKHLTCFYCGKRSGLRFDGTLRHFQCPQCDATNFLDERGEIADPPAATEGEATAVQYAAPQSSASAQQDDVFCQTCLKNQHLFTKSLAQYFPDDPSDPEYPELERNYYRYRRNLEKRYPQVCGDCADKVEARIRQAGYTAKTDHLRRMVDLSRGRKTRTRTSSLDWIHALGRTLWRGGFALQVLWHLVMMTQALQPGEVDGMYDPDDRSTSAAKALLSLKRATAHLPAADTLIKWSAWTGAMAAWWNPHFVQCNRGFTRHLLGFTQWYSLQGLTVFFRFVFRSVDVRGQAAPTGTAKLGAHVAMAFVTIVIYVLAGKSIRVDTRPLFATGDSTTTQSPVRRDTKSPQKQRRQQDAKTFSELFNDALDSADATPRNPGGAATTSMSPPPQSPFHAIQTTGSPTTRRGNAGLAATPRARQQQQIHYDDEMDWSPITPRHRALNGNVATTPTPSRFGHADAQSPCQQQPLSANPFRFKVPAAPMEPARRLRNPVWSPAPAAKQQAPETGRAMFTRRGHRPSSSDEQDGAGVEFKQPRFFAPERDHDTNSLADLLSQSFSLGQEQEATAEEPPGTTQEAFHRVHLDDTRRGGRPQATHWRSTARLEQAALVALLTVWLLATAFRIPYGLNREVQLGVLFLAGLVALRGTDGTGSAPDEAAAAPSPLLYLQSALGVAELTAICWLGWHLWRDGRSEEAVVGRYGAGVLTSMLVHRLALGISTNTDGCLFPIPDTRTE